MRRCRREKEERRYQEEQLKRDVEEARRRRIESEEREKREEEARNRRSEKGSEIDYGVEDSPPRPGSSKSPSSVKGGSAKGSRSLPSSSPTARSSASATAKNVKIPPSLLTRAGNVVMNVRKMVESMAGSFQTRPMLLMQMLAFIVGILVLVSRRDVKERVKSILGKGWGKVRQTAGMGVKVSYI